MISARLIAGITKLNLLVKQCLSSYVFVTQTSYVRGHMQMYVGGL